jgi:hypothetical protein
MKKQIVHETDFMKRKRNKVRTINFDISVNGNSVPVQATAYVVNKDEKRFRVSYNGSAVIIFAWNNELSKLVKSDATHLPSSIEREIVNELQERMVA